MLAWLQSVTVTDLLIVLQLVILEGLLSFDNALALAALVKKRLAHPEDQKHALLWGIWGAYVFRIGIIFIGVWLMQHEWVKAVAGLYLIWLAVSELFLNNDVDDVAADDEKPNVVTGRASTMLLWRTILAVEIMDIMFSIDSIGVALAISNVKWVLIAGAILGIVMMRMAAQMFTKLIDQFPVLKKTAFVLVGLAGVNVILKLKDLNLGFMTLTIDSPIHEGPFMALLLTILFGSMILNKLYPERFA